MTSYFEAYRFTNYQVTVTTCSRTEGQTLLSHVIFIPLLFNPETNLFRCISYEEIGHGPFQVSRRRENLIADNICFSQIVHRKSPPQWAIEDSHRFIGGIDPHDGIGVRETHG